jgi:hypothetical protein
MPKRDTSQEALRQVDKINGSKPVRGEFRVNPSPSEWLLNKAGTNVAISPNLATI